MTTIVTVDERQWTIVSHHVDDSRELPSLAGLNLFRIQRATVCTVSDPYGLTYQGAAYCSHQDVWDPEKGHRLALADALTTVKRGMRGLIWERYNIQHPPPPVATRLSRSRHSKRKVTT